MPHGPRSGAPPDGLLAVGLGQNEVRVSDAEGQVSGAPLALEEGVGAAAGEGERIGLQVPA